MSNEAFLDSLADTLESRKQADPASSYVAKLYHGGQDAILKKIGEEATETILAAKSGDRGHLIRETADLWFHSMIMLCAAGIRPGEIIDELRRREGTSGLTEKGGRTR
ncbi:MAG: phosphoribosyl-ATP diphosphatase [Burkholderiales bacterium]